MHATGTLSLFLSLSSLSLVSLFDGDGDGRRYIEPHLLSSVAVAIAVGSSFPEAK
jgi:hypothetical protein